MKFKVGDEVELMDREDWLAEHETMYSDCPLKERESVYRFFKKDFSVKRVVEKINENAKTESLYFKGLDGIYTSCFFKEPTKQMEFGF